MARLYLIAMTAADVHAEDTMQGCISSNQLPSNQRLGRKNASTQHLHTSYPPCQPVRRHRWTALLLPPGAAQHTDRRVA